jgi:restriction endonuclease S subunit
MQVFQIYSDKIHNRLDVTYYLPVYYNNLDRIKSSQFEIVPLEKLATKIHDGPGGWDINVSEYVDTGIPMLRVTNLREDGVSLDNVVYITEEKHQDLIRSEVLPKDVLLSMRGTIGIATVLPDTIEKANLNAAVCRIRTNGKVIPEYLALYLNTSLGRLQTKREGYKAVQSDLNLTAIKNIQVILPSIEKQKKIVTYAHNIFGNRRRKKLQAQELLIGVDNYILDKLGISIDTAVNSTNFSVWSDEIEGRFDPYFYKKRHISLFHQLENKHAIPLGKLIEFSTETWDQQSGYEDTFPYIEIGSISLNYGLIGEIQMIPVNEAPSRARMLLKQGDIIVSSTRPSRGAIAIVEKEQDGFICSTGFCVLRQLKTNTLNKEYLAMVLKTPVGLIQMDHRSSGGNYPAITTDELKKILIVVPSIELQNDIVKEVKKRKQEARALLYEINTSSEEVKSKIEQMILST